MSQSHASQTQHICHFISLISSFFEVTYKSQSFYLIWIHLSVFFPVSACFPHCPGHIIQYSFSFYIVTPQAACGDTDSVHFKQETDGAAVWGQLLFPSPCQHICHTFMHTNRNILSHHYTGHITLHTFSWFRKLEQTKEVKELLFFLNKCFVFRN